MNRTLHISLDVSDLEESVRFYSALFGAAPTKLEQHYAKFDLESPAINLTMQQKEHCCLQGLNRLGIQVESNAEIEAYKARLVNAGITIREETNAASYDVLQDKICFKDPSGFRWEVYMFGEDAENSNGKSFTAQA